jgi:ribonuclease III family protein
MSIKILNELKQCSQAGGTIPSRIECMAPLTLAYMGDAIFEIFVREYLIGQAQTSVHDLHRRAISYVNAASQARMIRALAEHLSPEEADMVRRGRNQKSGTVPKNADPGEYRYATGFETLLGWLYYKNQTERLMEVMQMAVNMMHSPLQEGEQAHEAI